MCNGRDELPLIRLFKSWSAPRLRGRGEQGEIATHTPVLMTLYGVRSPLQTQELRRIKDIPLLPALFTTASQARHAPPCRMSFICTAFCTILRAS
jgi:hypothetical protein